MLRSALWIRCQNSLLAAYRLAGTSCLYAIGLPGSLLSLYISLYISSWLCLALQSRLFRYSKLCKLLLYYCDVIHNFLFFRLTWDSKAPLCDLRESMKWNVDFGLAGPENRCPIPKFIDYFIFWDHVKILLLQLYSLRAMLPSRYVVWWPGRRPGCQLVYIY